MARILVTTLPHVGHLNPTFAIAHALQARGHELRYHDHPLISATIAAQGFARVASPPLGLGDVPLLWHKWRLQHARGGEETRRALLLFSSGLVRTARALTAMYARVRPDLIVNDVFHYGAKLAAEMTGIPWVDCWSAGLCARTAHATTPACRGRDAIGEGIPDELLTLFDRRLAAARRALGLPAPPPAALMTPSPWLQLYLTCEALELPVQDPGASAVFVGPSLAGRREQTPIAALPRDWLDGPVPLVYVSLGTFFNRRRDFFRTVVQAFAHAPVHVVVSTPFARAREFARLPANIRFFPYVRQLALMPHVHAFVTHGGANSVNEALAHGVPMLAVPVGGEQMYNARRICELGFGLHADVTRIDAATLRAQVQGLLDDARYRRAAAAACEAIARCDAPAVAARLIERVLRTRAPIRRPAGTALTLHGDVSLPAWAL